MIVFVSTQDSVEFLYRLVSYLTTEHKSDSDVDDDDEEEKEPVTFVNVFRLHGDMSQKVNLIFQISGLETFGYIITRKALSVQK